MMQSSGLPRKPAVNTPPKGRAASSSLSGHPPSQRAHPRSMSTGATGAKNLAHDSRPRGREARWGSNFWVTLVDPQTQTRFYACPSTGEVSWDPPVGSFLLPPSDEGEWWELADESRRGLPYFYHTKTGETVWERPPGFVIPLGILQNTALAKRLSVVDCTSVSFDNVAQDEANRLHPSRTASQRQSGRRSISEHPQHNRLPPVHTQLAPIPGSPYATELSEPPSPSSPRAGHGNSGKELRARSPESPTRLATAHSDCQGRPRRTDSPTNGDDSSLRKRSHSSTQIAHRPQQHLQSLDVALEKLEKLNVSVSRSRSDRGHRQPSTPRGSQFSDSVNEHGYITSPSAARKSSAPTSPSSSKLSSPVTLGGKLIGKPIMNHVATMQMSPVKNRAAGKPIAVNPKMPLDSSPSDADSETGSHPGLPSELVSDIQQFSETDYAKQYFSTHRSGFIFKRKIPVEQLMKWQKAPLTSPLLVLTRELHKEAVKIFKSIQFIMGDLRERDLRPTPAGSLRGVQSDSASNQQSSSPISFSASSTSLTNSSGPVLEQQRSVLGSGLLYGELRDEIYCQLMKQLSGNPSTESVFKGWQFLCVLLLTFPPSKNFETYLQSFITKHTTTQGGRVDVIAKYCLRRLSTISIKGPRGKPPSAHEIETASDAAFNPSTFGESLDAIFRLQERNYPHQKVPIILPFLANGILALGGRKAEGIFRVPGDSDSVSELKLRIDRGYYTLESVDDPQVLASLLKLWLRELCDPLIPSEMYNECIMSAQDPDVCVQIVYRLPTINRRVVLFVISFLQLFLDEKTQALTKMTPANLALVMAPNLLRCASDSMSVVFTNAQFEQIFIYNLLLHLKCDEVDASYKPSHGLTAGRAKPQSRRHKS